MCRSWPGTETDRGSRNSGHGYRQQTRCPRRFAGCHGHLQGPARRASDQARTSTSRAVEPVAVLGVPPHWYLWAHCRLREGERVFRLDRIRSAELLDEIAPDRGLDPADIELYELINRGILGE